MIHRKVARLEQFYTDILACRVMIESPYSHHHQGNLFHVGIDLTVPDGEIIVNRDPHEHHTHEDVFVAINDAFKTAAKKLQHFASKQSGDLKVREIQSHGVIFELAMELDYGKIRSSDGRELYFNRNDYLDDDFDELKIGDDVRYVEEISREGLRACSVHLVGKHHIFDQS